MELVFKARNMEVTEAAQSYAQRKMDKLVRHLGNINEAKVEFSQERTRSQGDRVVVQVTLNSTGTLLRAEERAADAFTAIDAVAGVLERQIERYKGKLYGRGKASSADRASLKAEELEEEPTSRVVKVKRFVTKPMSEEEAIEQMELLGHDFFAFFNAETDRFNVVYRRRDGDYGLLEPELT